MTNEKKDTIENVVIGKHGYAVDDNHYLTNLTILLNQLNQDNQLNHLTTSKKILLSLLESNKSISDIAKYILKKDIKNKRISVEIT